MAVPKKKRSKSKRNIKVAANWKVKLPEMTICPECKTVILTHTACTACGFYRGRALAPLVEKIEKKEKKQQEKASKKAES